MLSLILGQRAEDRPDIVIRVFKAKLDILMDDLKKHKHFGPTITLLCTIEFQKRGLPHVHYLVWLENDYKIRTPLQIDSIISTELSCKKTIN